MCNRIKLSTIFLLVFFFSLFSLFAGETETKAQKNVAWSKEYLEEPLSLDDGLITRDGNVFQFPLNKPGIPNEPVLISAKLSDKIDPETGKDITTGEELYSADDYSFVGGSKLIYLGGELTKLSPGSAEYHNNNNQTSGEGANVDLIKGAYATVNLTYTPEFTHQKGALWYTPYTTQLDFSAGGGSSQATVFANKMTFNPAAQKGESSVVAEILRAVSIYDPWFEKMEMKYDSKYKRDESESYRVDNWKIKYLAKSDEEHRNYGYTESAMKAEADKRGMSVNEFKDSLSDEERGIWAYPDPDDVSLYTDFQVTIREPIEKIKFTSHAQNKIIQSDGSLPVYVNINDPIRHPDQTAVDEIVCYDTSDAGAGEYTVDAFLITTEILPDYGYQLTFEIVEGASIGTIDRTGLDAEANSFRFVPNGERMNADGFMVKNYGNVVISVTASDINYKEYFTLRYLPSDLRLVAYIGEDEEDPDTESTVPDRWKNGVVMSSSRDESGRYYVDLENSGLWDVYAPKSEDESPSGTMEVELYGLQCLVLYPGESFDLAAVSYIRPSGDARESKTPYYMTTGVPAVDYTKPEGEQRTWTRYAITFGTYADSEADEEHVIKDVLGFKEYANIQEGASGIKALIKSNSDVPTGRSWWYADDGSEDGDALTITALKEGVVYLNYTLSPIDENTGEASLDSGTLTGGLYVFVVDPVDQALAAMVQKKTGDTGMSLLIPYDISIAQLGSYDKETGKIDDGIYIDGKEYASHWFLGKYGAVVDNVPNSGETGADNLVMYTGRSYASFSSRYGDDVSGINLTAFGRLTGAATDINKEGVATSKDQPFVISSANLIVPEFNLYNTTNGHQIGDIVVTGEFGINSFSTIKDLRIVDEDGALTKKNLINGEFDLSSLKIETYHHEGIGKEVSKEVKSMRFPTTLISLDLSPNGQDPDTSNENEDLSTVANWLDCTFYFGTGAVKNSNTLKTLDIGYNCFKDLRLTNFAALESIEAGGDLDYNSAPSGNTSRLYVSNVPSLKMVSANKTAFTYLNIEWPELPHTDFINWQKTEGNQAKAYTESVDVIKSAMRANDSTKLKGVTVSGSLTYLELVNDQALEFVYGSTEIRENENTVFRHNAPEFNYSPSSNTGSADWIKVLNLGGDSYISQHAANDTGASGGTIPGMPNSQYLGFRISETNGSTALFAPRSSGDRNISSDNIKEIRLNKINRLVWDDDNDGQEGGLSTSADSNKKLEKLEIYTVIGGLRNNAINMLGPGEISNVNDPEFDASGIINGDNQIDANYTLAVELSKLYDISLNHANYLTDIYIGYVYEDAYVDLSYAGSKTDEIMKIKIESLENYINLRNTGRADSISINEGRKDVNWQNAMLDLTKSNLIDLHGELKFTGISTNVSELTLVEGESTTLGVSAEPLMFQNQLTTTLTIAEGDANAVTITGADNVYTITAKETTEDKKLILKATGTIDGAFVAETTITLYIEKEVTYKNEITIKANPDTDNKLTLDGIGSSVEINAVFMNIETNEDTGEVNSTDITNSLFEQLEEDGDTEYIPIVTWVFDNPDAIDVEYLDAKNKLKAKVTAKHSEELVKFHIEAKVPTSEDGSYDVITSPEYNIWIKGAGRYEIRSSIDEVVFHDTASDPITLNVSVYDNELKKTLSKAEMNAQFTWNGVVDNTYIDYEIAGDMNESLTVTPKMSGTTTLEVTYQHIAYKGSVIKKTIPVRYHAISKVIVDQFTTMTSETLSQTFSRSSYTEKEWIERGKNGIWLPLFNVAQTTTAAILCAECDEEITAENNIKFNYSFNVEDASSLEVSQKDKNTLQVKNKTAFLTLTLYVQTLVYDGITYDAWLGLPVDQAKTLSLERAKEEQKIETIKEGMRLESSSVPAISKSIVTTTGGAEIKSQAVLLEERVAMVKALSSEEEESLSTPDHTVSAKVGTLILNQCRSMTNLVINDSYNNTSKVKRIYANESEVLKNIDLSTSQAEFIEATEGVIESVSFTGESRQYLTYLDLHNNKIGSKEGSFVLGSTTIKAKGSSYCKSFKDWGGIPLKEIYAYGNNIYYYARNPNNNYNGTVSYEWVGSNYGSDVSTYIFRQWVKGWPLRGPGMQTYVNKDGTALSNKTISYGLLYWVSAETRTINYSTASEVMKCNPENLTLFKAFAGRISGPTSVDRDYYISIYPFGK